MPLKNLATHNRNSIGAISFGPADSVVLPQDIYREQADQVNNLFGVSDYLPFIRDGELEHLHALITNSSTAQTIINKIVSFVVGNGFYLKKTRNVLGDEVVIELTEQQKDILYSVLTRVNSQGDTILDVSGKATYDRIAFGTAFAKLDVVDISGRKIVFAEHLHTNFVRPFRSLDLRTRFYGVSLDWLQVPLYTPDQGRYTSGTSSRRFNGSTNLPSNVIDIPAYPIFSRSLDEDAISNSSIASSKKYAAQSYFWGLPTWIASKHWIELEYRIAKFNVSKFKNGLTPSGILQVFGTMTDEKRKEYVHNMRAKMTDTGNDFKVIFQLLENPELAAKWIPFEQSYQGFFMELASLCKEFISIGFGIPLSITMMTAGSLGSNQQARDEFEIFENTVIKKERAAIIKDIVKPYLDTVAVEEGLEWLLDVELGFQGTEPVSIASALDPNRYITKDEGRELLKLPAMQEGDFTIEEEEMMNSVSNRKGLHLLKRLRNLFKR